MKAAPGIERRMVLQIIGHWDALRQDRRFPAPKELDPAVPPLTVFWQNCLVIKLQEQTDQSVLEYVGSSVLGESHLPDDWAGHSERTLNTCPENTLLAHAVSYAAQVVQQTVPISRGDSFVDGDTLVRFRSILLPMSTDGYTVDRLFGAVNCMRVDVNQAESPRQP